MIGAYRTLLVITLTALLPAVHTGPAQAAGAEVTQALEAVRAAEGPAGKEAVGRLAAAGGTAVAELTQMMGGDDHAAAWRVLHGLAVYVSAPGSGAMRRDFNRAVCRELASDNPAAVKELLIQQLHFSGGDDVVPTLGGLLADGGLHEPARQALLAIGTARAAAALRSALPVSLPAHRIGLVQALGLLKDSRSVDLLIAETKSDSEDLRAAAVSALGQVGAARSEAAIRSMLYGGSPRSRRAASHAYLNLADSLASAKNGVYPGVLDPRGAAAAMYRQIALASHEEGIRLAAENGLRRLAQR